MMKLRQRSSTAEDRAWVCCCWLETLARRLDLPRRSAHAMANALYPHADVRVIEAEGEPAVLVGFIAYIEEEPVCRYVSRQFRDAGVASLLG